MEPNPASLAALRTAIARAGSQTALARACGLTQPAISLWIKRNKPVPADYVLSIEAATGVSRHLLRPDIYPVEVVTAPAVGHGVDRGDGRVSFQNGGILQCNQSLGAAA